MPAVTPFEVYRDQLATLSLGIALWNPNPPKEIYDHVSIGDVGYLHEGTFIRLFNVMLKSDDPLNNKVGDPEPYESLDCGLFVNTLESNFDRLEIYSRYVSAETNASVQAAAPENMNGITYKFRTRGAILSLPNGGHREYVKHTKAFEDYIRDNVVSWYTWAQENKLGVERMEDLILVSGCMLVTSWAAATFMENTMDAKISLASRPFNNGGATFVWTNNQGPVAHHNSQIDSLNPPTLDQCVFIDGFRAKRTLFRIKHLRAAAEPRPDDPDNHRDDNIQVTRVPGASKYRDPLIGIMDHIAEVRPLGHDYSRSMYSAGPQKKCPDDARIAQGLFPSTPPIPIDGPSESRVTHHLSAPNVLHVHSNKSHVTIDILPDDVLLHIFHFYRLGNVDQLENIDRLRQSWRWYRLVHVCRRWRSLVFASPNFLDLKVVCRPWTRVEFAGTFPPLPIIIRNTVKWPIPSGYDFGAAIVHSNYVREIELLYLTSSQLQQFASALQGQFPSLIHLRLVLDGDYSRPTRVPALPNGFLAPRLQSLTLKYIPFPALPKLLLSATDLVNLTLMAIPHSGYISPEAMVTGLAVLANLESLTVAFESPLSHPDRQRRRPPPPTRTVLPSLTHFEFKGVSDYLEDLAARIDTPLLDSICITFFHQLVFDIPQLAQFMRRTTRPETLNEAHVYFDYYGLQVGYFPPTRNSDKKSRLRISCEELDWQLSSLAQIFTPFFPFIDKVDHLYIYGNRRLPLQWQDDVEDMQWLEVFQPFIAVKNLYIFKEFVQCIAPALELVGERVTDVLPALESLFLEKLQPSGPVQEAIEQFATARQLSGHFVAVSHWNRA